MIRSAWEWLKVNTWLAWAVLGAVLTAGVDLILRRKAPPADDPSAVVANETRAEVHREEAQALEPHAAAAEAVEKKERAEAAAEETKPAPQGRTARDVADWMNR